jgi:hypothetical protein
MAIRNTRELAARLRQNAADCEQATEQVRPEHRARLMKAAEHYRVTADKIETPGSVRDPLPTSLAVDRAIAEPSTSESVKSSMPPGLAKLASLLKLCWPKENQTATQAQA